ncbi:MAG: acylneuraminate cytidylyltransferase family protein [Nanoarchaeota archaeon]|nr:acylneuraminate cytidylyltransferase family protein [Nanoarchaeota archaeon]
MKKEILGIIPARGGSKGVPRKNIKLLAGKPLIAYSIEEAKKSEHITKLIVSTDDQEIADISRAYGAEIPFLRNPSMAKDNIPLFPDTVKNIVEELEKKVNYLPEIIVVLQPTSPFRTKKHIESAIEKLIESKSDWVTSICKSETNPAKMYVLKEDRLFYFLDSSPNLHLQRQEIPPVYKKNGAVSVMWRDSLKKAYNVKESNWGYIEMGAEESVDINTPLDFMIAETIMKKRRGNYS